MGHRQYSITNSAETQKMHAQLLTIALSKDEADWKNIHHTHHFTELLYVIDGKGQFLLRDEPDLTIEKGDLIIVPPHTEHTEYSSSQSPLKYYVLGIDGISFQTEDKKSHTHLLCNFSSNNFIEVLFDQMLSEMQANSYGASAICQRLLEVLLIKITQLQSLQPVPATTRKMTKECAKIKEYLDTNYAEPITLDMLTGLTHMNKYYMAHSFTKYTGFSPIQYLTEVRLKTACSLLEKTDFSISDISSSIGFSSPSYFTQAFRRKYGITPIKYRKQSESITLNSPN